MKKILLTGFNAFGNIKVNPSEVIVKEIAHRSRLITDYKLYSEILPTEFINAGEKITELIENIKPDIILNMGVAEKETTLSIERIALNLNDTLEPDNAGYIPKGLMIKDCNENAFFTNFPTNDICKLLENKNIPVKVSNHAGTYVCNHVFYLSFYHSNKIGINPLIGFIHVPLPREYRAKSDTLVTVPYLSMIHSIMDVINFLANHYVYE